MKLISLIFTNLILLLFLASNGLSQKTFQDCVDIPAQLKNVNIAFNHSGERIADLFRVGDKCIKELTDSLENVDPIISRNAELIISYLRNKRGLQSLENWQQNNPRNTYYPNYPIPKYLPQNQQNLIFADDNKLAEKVADKLFVEENSKYGLRKDSVKSRLLGFNGARTKALIEIDIAEATTHHIILIKRQRKWSPLLITLVSSY